MIELHLDLYAKQEGFYFTGEYIKSCLLGNVVSEFRDFDTFLSLIDNGLIPNGTFLRTLDNKNVGRCYKMIENKLVGLDFGAGVLEKRVYGFDEVFENGKFDHGFFLNGTDFKREFLSWVKN